MVSFLFLFLGLICQVSADGIGLAVIPPPPDPTQQTTSKPTGKPSTLPPVPTQNPAVKLPVITSTTPKPTIPMDNPTIPPLPTKTPTVLTTTQRPTLVPSKNPTPQGIPTDDPTTNPTTKHPTGAPPTRAPTNKPSIQPSMHPTTSNPSAYPSLDPTFEPTLPSNTCCGCMTVALNINNRRGCNLDTICEANICNMDEWCCNTHWDRKCVDAATSICTSQTKQPSVSPTRAPVIPCCGCAEAKQDTGCSIDAVCQTNVCGVDKYCCNSQWDGICAKAAEKVCEFKTFLPSLSPTETTYAPTSNPTTPAPTIFVFPPPPQPTPKPSVYASHEPTGAPYPHIGNPTTPAPTPPKVTDNTFFPSTTTQATSAKPTPGPVCANAYPGLPGNCGPVNQPIPTPRPTSRPTPSPTPAPSELPTNNPSNIPTTAPTIDPTASPSFSPTERPTDSPHTPGEPSRAPSFPTDQPTKSPSVDPTSAPTTTPTTAMPSSDPTDIPSNEPSIQPSLGPTASPGVMVQVNSAGSISDGNANESSLDAALWIEGIGLLVISTLLMSTLYFFFMKKKEVSQNNEVTLIIKFPVLIALLFNFIGILCMFWKILFVFVRSVYIFLFLGIMGTSFILQTNGSYNTARMLYFALTVSYAIGKVFMEIFFIIRLYTSFKGSSFELSNHTLTESAILIIAISVLWCYTWLSHTDYIYIQWIALSAEIFLTCWLLILFVSKLSKLILMQKTDKQQSIEMSTTKSMPTVSRFNSNQSASSPTLSPLTCPSTDYKASIDLMAGDTDDESRASKPTVPKKVTITSAAEMQLMLSETQQKLIYVITRSIVLSSIAMITTTLFSVYAFFYVSSGMNGLFILYILWTLDMTANSICIFLNFKHSKSSYERYCGLCHGCIQFLIRRCSAQQIINDNVRRLDNYQTASAELKAKESKE